MFRSTARVGFRRHALSIVSRASSRPISTLSKLPKSANTASNLKQYANNGTKGNSALNFPTRKSPISHFQIVEIHLGPFHSKIHQKPCCSFLPRRPHFIPRCAPCSCSLRKIGAFFGLLLRHLGFGIESRPPR